MSIDLQSVSNPSIYEPVDAAPGSCKSNSCTNVGSIERAASIGCGIALLACGARPGASMFGRSIPVLMAAGLLYRGITGNCELYRAVGIDRS